MQASLHDENSTAAVSLLPPTTLPPLPVSPSVTPASADMNQRQPNTAGGMTTTTTPPTTHLPTPPSAQQPHVVESDSNEEAPLFQRPPLSTPSPVSLPPGPHATYAWAGVSATPPSHIGGSGTAGLFPASAVMGDSASTPAGQSLHLPVGRDLSNRYSMPPIKARSFFLPPRASTTAQGGGGGGIVGGYAESSSSESLPIANVNGSGVVGAQRSLFRSASTMHGPVPVSPQSGLVGVPWQSLRFPGDENGGGSFAAPSTPLTPANAGDAVLVMEPPTPAKQRRTIHTGPTPRGVADGPLCTGPRMSTATSAAAAAAASYPSLAGVRAAAATAASCTSTSTSFNASVATPAKGTPACITVPGLRSSGQASSSSNGTTTASPSLPRPTTPSTTITSANAFAAVPSLSFKFHKREGSRKRSADVLSQFSALDLDETPATPCAQSVAAAAGGRFASLSQQTNAFPSQPSMMTAAAGGMRGATMSVIGPTSPLMTGYATPVTLSQQIGGSNTFSQLLLHPSQDILDMSQADTECSNFLARRIVNDYNEVRLLGKGSFGTVSLYKEISSGEYVAVKTSPLLRTPDMERRYRRERSIMGMVRGLPHLVQLSAAWEEGRVPRMYLQLEYCPGGSLASVASAKQARNEPWAEAELKVFLAHMCIALDAMHRANIAHVDFKPDNVLLDKNGAYKLSDFGCSVLLDNAGRPCAETQNGYSTPARTGQPLQQGVTPLQPQPQSRSGGLSGIGALNAYGSSEGGAAPAIGTSVVDFNWSECNETSNASVDEGDCRYLCADMLNEKRYFKAGDMFSLGMSLYELMSGQPLPRNGDQFLALRRQAPTEVLLRRGYSSSLVWLVAALLRSDPTQRPTARQVLQYLRPSAAELALLGSADAMQQWTDSAESFHGLQHQDQHQQNVIAEGDTVPSTTALRCMSALMEASTWLLMTTQHDLHRRLADTREDSADEERGAHRHAPARALQCPMQRLVRGGGNGEGQSEMSGVPMSPTTREEACTPTTLQY